MKKSRRRTGWVFAAVGVALLAACQKPVESAPSSGDGSYIDSLIISKRKLVETLTYPDSAKYADVMAYPYDASRYIFCGKVKATSTSGINGPYQRFIATPEGAAVELSAADFEAGWDQHCVGNGIDVSNVW